LILTSYPSLAQTTEHCLLSAYALPMRPSNPSVAHQAFGQPITYHHANLPTIIEMEAARRLQERREGQFAQLHALGLQLSERYEQYHSLG
jgi:hypothetical protein